MIHKVTIENAHADGYIATVWFTETEQVSMYFENFADAAAWVKGKCDEMESAEV